MISLLFQPNIFNEDDTKHLDILKKYFHVIQIGEIHKTEYYSEGQFCVYRCSIENAKRNKVFEKFTNCLDWAGRLRNEMVTPHFYFQTLDFILEDWDSDVEEYDSTNKRLFVRPVSGDKLFAGNVYSYKSLKNEFDFLAQKNADKHTLCLVSIPVSIKEEYRMIFIDGKYISGSQYMMRGELCVNPEVPDNVIEYAKNVHKKYNLPPWVVIDVGMVYGNPSIIELNQIETSSFYAADLDKIYKAWADYY